MLLTEEEARQKFCVVMTQRPRPIQCCASQCMAYWKWADAEHTIGYCSITGKPEF